MPLAILQAWRADTRCLASIQATVNTDESSGALAPLDQLSNGDGCDMASQRNTSELALAWRL